MLPCNNQKVVVHDADKHKYFLYYSITANNAAIIKWAPSSEFVSSSIPSWQILTAHAQPFRGARDLAFCLKVPFYSLLVWASSEGSGETARMRRLAWTFAARIGYKYQIRLTRSKCLICYSELFIVHGFSFISAKCHAIVNWINIFILKWATSGQNQQYGLYGQWRLRSVWAFQQVEWQRSFQQFQKSLEADFSC